MYAVIENGGKQYKAIEGGYIEIDLLPDEIGKKKTFDKVLLLSTDDKVEVGTPYLKGVTVDVTVISHFKGQKITVFKYRPKQRYRVKTGHRQKYSRVLVDSIAFSGKKATIKKSADESVKKKPATTTKKSTATKKTTGTSKPKAKKPATSKTTKSSSTSKKTTSTKPKASTTKKATASKSKTTTTKSAAKSTTTAKKTTTSKTAAKKSTSSKSNTTKKTKAEKK